jgi:hypothetical protein
MEPSKETGRRSMQYLSDIMHAMNNAGTREAFLLRSHAANYALFISGIFADNVENNQGNVGNQDVFWFIGQAIFTFVEALAGFVIGGALATWRVLRCNPLFHSRHDPVPPKHRCQEQH